MASVKQPKIPEYVVYQRASIASTACDGLYKKVSDCSIPSEATIYRDLLPFTGSDILLARPTEGEVTLHFFLIARLSS